MKKKIISICITLFIFFSSTVGVFAAEFTQSWSVDAEYWLYDLFLQTTTTRNALSGDWGYGMNDAQGVFVFQLNGGYDLKLTYNVPAGETVYFRWAIPSYSLPEGESVIVVSYADYEQIDIQEYRNWSVVNPDANGDSGSSGTITIVEDYKNTSNETVTVDFYIDNIENDFGLQLIPILSGTKYFINGSSNEIVSGNSSIDIELEFIGEKLTDIHSDLDTYLGEINTSISLNGQKLDSITDWLTSINNTTVMLANDVNTIKYSVRHIDTLISEINDTTKLMNITLNNIHDALVNNPNSSDKYADSNAQLSDKVNTLDSIEKGYFGNLDSYQNMIPEFNFEGLSDFSTTASFVAMQMQNIFNIHSSLKYVFMASLTFGLALLFIGRGND